MKPVDLNSAKLSPAWLTSFSHLCRAMGLWTLALIVVSLGAFGSPGKSATADETLADAATDDSAVSRGRVIYAESCAVCHGDRGEGVPGSYEAALVGDYSVTELAAVITGTMPEGSPEDCVADDAEAVARFVFDAFYSEAAQMRLVTPRAALARLTSNQYRQSVSDLFSHFMGQPDMKEERGLTANYFDHPGWRNEKKVLTRVDPNIDVDYGQASPGEGMEETKFAVYWSGALLAPETGTYQIKARGKGSFIVKFIDKDAKFFDNHVSSGEMAEHVASVELVGGRLYPISVDLIKRERKTGNVDISMTLAWKTPKGIEEPIPSRYLIPTWAPTSFAPQVPMPPDDRSAGYERGSTISREWDESTTRGALELADAMVKLVWPKYLKDSQKKDESLTEADVLQRFGEEFVSQALRRPVDDSLRQIFVDAPIAASPDTEEAIRRLVLLTLKSPRFLYPAIDGDASPGYRRANRLALTLWDSIPDASLQTAAGRGDLEDEESVRRRARRMIEDPRARAKIMAGMHEWLDLNRWEELSKSQELFPDFDERLVADLRASLDLFLEQVVWSETSDFRQLLQADWSVTSDRIAEFYGESWAAAGEPIDGRYARTGSDAALRSGVVTHPLLMSALAYGDTSAPIFRGVFLLRHMLGRIIRVPNEAFTPFAADLHPDLTTRERVALQTASASCQGCHVRINGVGFALESFDAVGRLRTHERSKPIDATGLYVDRQGQEIRFDGLADLTSYLATSDDVVDAFINRMFLHFVKQPIGAYGENRQEELKTRFRESGYHVRELLVEIAVIAADGPTPATEI
ncbi:MAG: DUF1592 domain-containing protein [Planctomycetaceae bacterium]|nr:MAG: DUF1592 domain-containing protein [Planctomycetaceae bacterium]